MSVLIRDRRGKTKRHRERPQEDGGRGWLQPHKECQGLPAPPELGGRPAQSLPWAFGAAGGLDFPPPELGANKFLFTPPVRGHSLRQPQDPSTDPEAAPWAGSRCRAQVPPGLRSCPTPLAAGALLISSWCAGHWRCTSLCDGLLTPICFCACESASLDPPVHWTPFPSLL